MTTSTARQGAPSGARLQVDSPGGRQDEAKGAVEHSTNHKVGGLIWVSWEKALVGRAWGHRAWAPPPAKAARCSCPGCGWLPWGG